MTEEVASSSEDNWPGATWEKEVQRPASPLPEGRADGEVWLPGMLATIWWAVDGGPIGVNHAMRRDSDWVACGDVAVPDEFVLKAERIDVPDPEPLRDGLNDINRNQNIDFSHACCGCTRSRGAGVVPGAVAARLDC